MEIGPNRKLHTLMHDEYLGYWTYDVCLAYGLAAAAIALHIAW